MNDWNEPPKVQKPYIVETIDGKRIEIRTDDRPKIFRALSLFGKAFRKQMFEDGTLCLSGAAGLWQGLKYKGSIQKGLITAVVVDATISTMNGIRVVAQNWEDI